uniref:Uncharacterized protein n=1 Tax=Strigamia maritima TaxID=126957 RepID=T1IPM9_STRMM
MEPHLLLTKKNISRQYLVQAIRKELDTKQLQIPIVGLSFVEKDQRPRGIRITWLFILFSCFVTCGYQAYDRVMYYCSYPIRVDVKYNFGDNYLLPSVTVCAHDTPSWIEYVERNPEFVRLMRTFQDVFPCANQMLVFFNFFKGKMLIPIKNIQLNYTNLPLGVCLQFSYENCIHLPFEICCIAIDDTNAVTADRLDFKIKKPKGGCNRTSRLMLTFQKNKMKSNLNQFWHVPTNSRVQINVGLIEYNFVTSPWQKCDSIEDHESCFKNCLKHLYSTFYNYKLSECRYPFDPAFLEWPVCKPNRLSYIVNTLMHVRVNPSNDCNCPEPCTDYAFNININYYNDPKPDTKIRIKKGASVTTFNQLHSYDIVTLLCDIGGNLGLLLGLSVLSICDVFYISIKKLYIKRCLKISKPNHNHSSKIRDICKIQMMKNKIPPYHTSISTKITENKKSLSSILCIAIYLTSMAFCSYIMLNRTSYFLSFPTKTITHVERNLTIQFPTITVCADNFYVQSLREWYLKLTGNQTCLPLDHYLDISETTIHDLWQNSATGDVIAKQYFNGRYNDALKFFITTFLNESTNAALYSNVPTLYGNCAEYMLEPLIQHGTTTIVESMIYSINETFCEKPAVTVFLTETDIPSYFDLSTRLQIPVNKIALIAIQFIKVLRLNTRSYKCLDRGCLLCLKAESDNCKCLPSCTELKYEYNDFIESHEEKFTFMHFFFSKTLFETVQEIYSYTFIKYICDVGGVLSIGLGFTVLTFFDTLQIFLYKRYALLFHKDLSTFLLPNSRQIITKKVEVSCSDVFLVLFCYMYFINYCCPVYLNVTIQSVSQAPPAMMNYMIVNNRQQQTSTARKTRSTHTTKRQPTRALLKTYSNMSKQQQKTKKKTNIVTSGSPSHHVTSSHCPCVALL